MGDRIDGWIASGLLGGAEPKAADFQIAPTMTMLSAMEDLRPMIGSRPAALLSSRLAPDFPAYLSPNVLPLT